MTTKDITEIWGLTPVLSITPFFTLNNKNQKLLSNLTEVQIDINYTMIKDSINLKYHHGDENFELKKICDEIYNEESSYALGKKINFFQKLFSTISFPTKEYITNSINKLVTYGDSFNTLYIDHSILPLNEELFFVDLTGSNWIIERVLISNVFYYPNFNSARYELSNGIVFDGASLNDTPDEGNILTCDEFEKKYVFLNEDDALSFYNKAVSDFLCSNKIIEKIK